MTSYSCQGVSTKGVLLCLLVMTVSRLFGSARRAQLRLTRSFPSNLPRWMLAMAGDMLLEVEDRRCQ